MRIESDRVSKRYGWKVHSVETVAGDGKQVTLSRVGKRHGPRPWRTFSIRRQATGVVVYGSGDPPATVAIALLGAVRKTGTETVLGLTAELLEYAEDITPRTRWWVADHPVLVG